MAARRRRRYNLARARAPRVIRRSASPLAIPHGAVDERVLGHLRARVRAQSFRRVVGADTLQRTVPRHDDGQRRHGGARAAATAPPFWSAPNQGSGPIWQGLDETRSPSGKSPTDSVVTSQDEDGIRRRLVCGSRGGWVAHRPTKHDGRQRGGRSGPSTTLATPPGAQD
jgi:hypothetical protein